MVVWSALGNPDCIYGGLRLFGLAVGAVLIGSGVSALVEGTQAKYADSARAVNVVLTVLGYLLLLPWTAVAFIASGCH